MVFGFSSVKPISSFASGKANRLDTAFLLLSEGNILWVGVISHLHKRSFGCQTNTCVPLSTTSAKRTCG